MQVKSRNVSNRMPPLQMHAEVAVLAAQSPCLLWIEYFEALATTSWHKSAWRSPSLECLCPSPTRQLTPLIGQRLLRAPAEPAKDVFIQRSCREDESVKLETVKLSGDFQCVCTVVSRHLPLGLRSKGFTEGDNLLPPSLLMHNEDNPVCACLWTLRGWCVRLNHQNFYSMCMSTKMPVSRP
jgi:hypothetical protein